MPDPLFESLLDLCRVQLSALRESKGSSLTIDEIRGAAEELAGLRTFAGRIDIDVLVARLEEIFTAWADAPRVLGSDDDHIPWLHIAKGTIDWRFWTRYRLYLMARQRLDDAAVRNVEKLVDEVLARIENPDRDAPWDRRGLVMGNVQSGKTAAYTGLICKSADAGYKVIIVLAGMYNNLRSQTQVRLDEGFLGYRASPQGSPGGFEPAGVHEFGPGLYVDSVTNRHDKGDFSRTVAKQFAIHPGGNPLLFVVKKNVTILKNLLAWIHHSADATDPETGRKYHRNVPLLLIDDEADQASIDTNQIALDEEGNPDPDHDPTKTNRLIRSLLHSFDKSAYVGFTATPFANVFIHEKAKTPEFGEDLFPRSFIVNLPAPSTYTGAARIFGIDEDPEAGLPRIDPLPLIREVDDHAETDATDETRGWMPPRLTEKTGHVPLIAGERKIPESLRKAIMSFLLAASIREMRESSPLINSMLVHVVRYTRVQAIVCEEIEAALRAIVNRLELGDGGQRPTVIDEFRELWDQDFVPTNGMTPGAAPLPHWEQTMARLKRIVPGVKVRPVNGSAEDALDYEAHRSSGLNVIVVGGDKLSRGLTLEGLSVSYFLRASRMYDTLMQMGRWFGYRERYLDVCRLFTTRELITWFGHIARASEELKNEFDYMLKTGATPRDYGLRIRSHPVLSVTSAVKMRNGTEMRLSYAGQLSQTVSFEHAASGPNLRATLDLLEGLGRPDSGSRTGGYLWQKRSVELILRFLRAYSTVSNAPRANSGLWAQYIEKQLTGGELVEWSILLASSSDPSATTLTSRLADLDTGAIERKHENDSRIGFSIGRLVSPSDEWKDLDERTEMPAAIMRARELWELDTRQNKSATPPETPTGRSARLARPKRRGLLMIYPLEPVEASGSEAQTDPVIGVAISFPESDTAKDISYVVSNRFAEELAFGEI